MSGAGSARHLAAIVAADVVGYSRLMGADEAGTLTALRACRRELLDPLVAAHDGRIVKSMGDGLLLTFTSVVEAVACALAIQRGMSERNRDVPAERRIIWRIGITIGDVVVEDGDVFGDGVNQAARLEQLALPGGICIADDAWRQTRGRIDIEAIDGGSQRLKNITGPIRVHHLATGSGAAGRPAERIHAALAHPARIAAAALAAVLLVLVVAALWLRPDISIWRMSPVETVVARAPPIVAVLPFADLSAESERDYLADGLTAEVIAALGRFQSLRVIGRNAVMAFKGRPVTREEIASELGASYLVEGDLRRAGERVRLAAELTDAHSGTVLWSNRYEGELADVFDFHSTIAREVAGTLAAGITQIEARRRLEQPPPDPDAYGLFLQARAIGYATSRADNRRVRELASRAIELDPGYAMAHALLAEAIFSQAVNGWTEFVTREARRGEEHAHRAIALAPDEPDGYRALAATTCSMATTGGRARICVGRSSSTRATRTRSRPGVPC